MASRTCVGTIQNRGARLREHAPRVHVRLVANHCRTGMRLGSRWTHLVARARAAAGSSAQLLAPHRRCLLVKGT